MRFLVQGFWNKSNKIGLEGLQSGSRAQRETALPFPTSFPTPSSIGAMSEREERRFVEIPRESVRLMAESTGLELSDEVAALLAEDVCYRLREATQVHSPSLSLPGTALSPGVYSASICQVPPSCSEYSGGGPCPLQGLLGSWASSEPGAC